MSETATLTLSEFLVARLAEDEADAPNVHHFDCVLDHLDSGLGCSCSWPASIRADVAGKRAILAWDAEQPVDRGVLELLAQPYADHPDFREEWG